MRFGSVSASLCPKHSQCAWTLQHMQSRTLQRVVSKHKLHLTKATKGGWGYEKQMAVKSGLACVSQYPYLQRLVA